jgi:hypothetical protein
MQRGKWRFQYVTPEATGTPSDLVLVAVKYCHQD